jgi:hypothetical protein
MESRVAILLGRTVWARSGGSWLRRSFGEGAGMTSPAVLHAAEILSGEPPGKTVLIFEPEGMAHQAVDTPKASRSIFASLARVRSEHPVVMSERLGWGIEPPESTQGGAFSTLLHSELAPGLVYLREACIRGGSELAAAWPAYTAAAACMKPCVPPSHARSVLMLTPDFVGVSTCGGGKRSFKGWVGPMSDRDWRAFSMLIGDFEARPSHSMAEAALRRGGIAVIADGEPKGLCPIWGEISASGRLETIVDMDALAESAALIPARHPANLAETFPRALRLDGCLVGGALLGTSAAIALGALDLGLSARLRSEGESYRMREASLGGRLEILAKNQAEMTALRKEAPEQHGYMQFGRHNALTGLAADVPDALTLTALSIGRDNSFEIEAIVVGTGFDPESLRLSLERRGFKPAGQDGWAFDAASGRLVVRGKYGGPQT